MQDPITDMFNRIRNAQKVGRQTVDIPFSNLKYEIAGILEKEGFVDKIEKKGKTEKRIIEVKLKVPGIDKVKRVSKSGQRIYGKYIELKPVRSGFGISIISTSKGIMSNKEARKQKLGGEIICEVW